MKNLSLLTALIFFCTSCLAHKPVLSADLEFSAKSPYIVEEPEISKAIFSNLNGSDHYYKIDSDRDFDFYAAVLAPKIDECHQQHVFSFEVLDADFHTILFADGERYEWWPWYEKYGGQWYWSGPEIGENFASNRIFKAGTYYIKVFNQNNQGKYILAVGDVEKFSIGDFFGLFFTMGDIEEQFWGSKVCE